MVTQKETGIVQMAMNLAVMIKTHANSVEDNTYKMGDNLVGIFADENCTPRRFPDVNERKIEVLLRAIEDISAGVMALRSSIIGLTQTDNKILPFIALHGNRPSGNVVFSIAWKNLVAFKSWRSGKQDTVSQDDINFAIYRLSVEISRLLT